MHQTFKLQPVSQSGGLFASRIPNNNLQQKQTNWLQNIRAVKYNYYYYYYYYYYSALEPIWTGTRAHSGDRYGSGTLHPGQVLRGSLPLLSPAFGVPNLPPGASMSATTREILAAKGGTMGEKGWGTIWTVFEQTKLGFWSKRRRKLFYILVQLEAHK